METMPMSGSKSFVAWRKSTASNSGGCVEVAATADGSVLTRDSKNPLGAMLQFPGSTWTQFMAAARDGNYDTKRMSK